MDNYIDITDLELVVNESGVSYGLAGDQFVVNVPQGGKVGKALYVNLGQVSQMKVNLFEGARASVVVYASSGECQIDIEQREGSIFDLVLVNNSADSLGVKVNTVLSGVDAKSGLFVLNVAKEQGICNFDSRVNHNVEGCDSYQLVKSMSWGKIRSTSMVYVAQNAQKTNAEQQNRSVLMSESAQISTTPQLEIYADDVKCSHGATTGQIDEHILVYMRQRGLSFEGAKRLLMEGFVRDVLNRVESEELQQILLQKIG